MKALAALLLALAGPALGARPDAVRRGNLIVHVKISGTSIPLDVFRLKSAVEGRLESVTASSFTWRSSGDTLAELASKELAAMIDAKGSQDEDVVEDRWSKVYKPTPVRCAEDCYVLKIFARPHAWVKPQAILFEAARGLRLVGRVGGLDAGLIRDGMTATFWSSNDPSRRATGRVADLTRDLRGGGDTTFTLEVPRGLLLPPGTQWEGEIVPMRKNDVLMVPTAALIESGGRTYLPVRVSTGVTTDELTQIVGGADEKREFLILDDAQLRGAARHARQAPAPERELREDAVEAAPAPKPAPAPPPARKSGRNDDGEDPYGDN